MIKVKIQNPTLGRNEITFRPFLQLSYLLKNYSIDITTSDDFDLIAQSKAHSPKKTT